MKKLSFLLTIFLPACLCAQDTTVKITGTGPRSSVASATILYKSALVTFGIGNGTIDGTGAATLPIMINNKTGQLATALQFDVSFVAAEVTGSTMLLTPALVALGKSLSCSAQSATTHRCIISGGQNGIPDGSVVQATFQTSTTSQANTTVVLLGTVAANISGSNVATAVAPGGGVISMPPLVASISCSQPDIWAGVSVDCTVALNKPAPGGGAGISLVSDSALVAVPASVSVSEGSTTVSFMALGK